MDKEERRKYARRRYGARHKRIRALVAQRVAAGIAVCCRCSRPIPPGSKWHLDHADNGVDYLGPSHARCNIAAPGVRGGAAVLVEHARARRGKAPSAPPAAPSGRADTDPPAEGASWA